MVSPNKTNVNKLNQDVYQFLCPALCHNELVYHDFPISWNNSGCDWWLLLKLVIILMLSCRCIMNKIIMRVASRQLIYDITCEQIQVSAGLFDT